MSAYDTFLQETKSAPSSGGIPKVVPPEVGGGGQPATPAISAYERFQQETKGQPVILPTPQVEIPKPITPENTSGIKKVSNFLSDWLINKPIDYLGEKLYESNPQYFQDVSKGLDIIKQEGGENAGEEILKTLQQGERAISGLTGGIITPKTQAPDNLVSKIYGGFSEAIGTVVALKGIGSGLGALTNTPAITAYLAKNPLVYKYALPFIQNAVGFSIYGQLDPELGNKVGERFKKLGIDIATSVPYTLLGKIKTPKVSIPSSFALGFGMAKLSGASNEDAFISGTVLGGLDAYSRLGGSGNHFTDGRAVEKKLTIEALNILNKYAETKLTPKSSAEEIKKAFYKGAQATHPDKTGGTDTEFKKINSAYQFLAPKGAKIPIVETPKGEKVPTGEIKNLPTKIETGSAYETFLKEKGVDLSKPAIEIQKAIESIPKTPAPVAVVPPETIPKGNEVIAPKPTEIAPNTNIEPIVQEAKKYKSVEEFVKAQGKVLYHGSGEEIKKFEDKGKGGVWLTSDKKMADIHAGFIEWGSNGNKKATITESFYTPKKVYKIPEGIDSFTGRDNNDLIEMPQEFPDKIESLKKQGFDSIQSSDKKQLFIFDPTAIKTKSQLNDIWNKSQETIQKEKIKSIQKNETKNVLLYNKDSKLEYKQVGLTGRGEIVGFPVFTFVNNNGMTSVSDEKTTLQLGESKYKNPKRAIEEVTKNLIDKAGGEKELKDRFIKAQEDKVKFLKEQKISEPKLPKSGTVGASIGKYREEGGKESDVVLGNYDQIKPIEFPELVSLAKDLSGSEIFIKKYKMANGMFYGKDARIGLNPDLFKAGNLQQLQKTMAHEIGHLIDYLPDGTLARGNVLARLATLRNFHKDFYAKVGATRSDPEVNDQLWKLSKYWKPIDEAKAPKGFLAYRKSSAEIYADFISVMFNNPKLASDMAPTAYNIFFQQLDAKPDVKSAYFELQDILRNGEKVAEMRKDKTQNMFTSADQISKDRQNQIELEEEQKKKSLWFLFKFQAVSRFESFREKVSELEKKGIYVNPDDNPVYFLEESNYLGGRIKAEVDTRFNTIYQELQKNGLTWDDLGEITFYERILKGDRAEVANPEGLQIDFVQELYDGMEGVKASEEESKKGSFSMKSQLGEEKFSKLQDLAVQYRLQIKELFKLGHEAGLISKDTWSMIEKNDFYVPFKPIKYAGTKTSYRIKNQKGTLHAIENPANTGIEKSVSLIRAIEKNKVNKASIDFLAKYYPSDLKEANYAFNGKARIALEPLDKNMRLVRYMDAGKMKAYYVDQYIGEALQRTPVSHSNLIIEGLRFMNSGLFRPLFITFNLGFQSFNFVRDMTRFWKNVPQATLLQTIKLYAKSARPAKIRAFGLPKNPSKEDKEAYDLINKLEEDRVLSITYNDLIKGEDVEDRQIDRIMREAGVRKAEPTKLGALASKFGISKKTPVIKQILGIMNFIESTGNLIESLPKIAGFYALKDKMAPAEMRSYVRRKVGSPDFLDGGKFKPAMNEIFLFSNSIFQGIRSDYETATDPKTRSGYWWKTMQANILPKLLMILAVAGVFGDEIKKLFGKISEYDKTNYITIPFGEDNNGKAVYVRIPHDETGRIISGMMWKIASAIQDPKKLGNAETYTNILAYAGGQAPSVSPAVSAVYNVATFMSGQNPYDFFRGRNVLTDEQMTAGGMEKTKPFLSYMFDNLGGATFAKLYTNETVPKTPSLSERIIGLPIISNVAGRWIKSSNYGETEKLRSITSEIDQKKAREALQNRRTIFDAVDKAQGKSYAEANKIKMDMIKSVVGQKVDTPEKRALVQSLGTRFDKLRVRGSADRNVDALITAQSNEAKVALLKEFQANMSTSDFNDLKKFIIKNRVVSSVAYQQFLRENK